MEDLRYLFDSFMMLFNHPFEIYGYSISFFDIFIFSILAGIVGGVLGSIFGGD